MSTRDEQNARYRAGLCVDCGEVEHSAGRPRCSPCHVVYVATRHEPQQEVASGG